MSRVFQEVYGADDGYEARYEKRYDEFQGSREKVYAYGIHAWQVRK